jgi:hypothetical protein
MHPALRALLTETVQHATVVSRDSHGKPTYSTPVPRAARVEWVTQRFVTDQGEDRMSRAVVYLEATFPLQVQDRLILADGSTPAIQRLEAWKDEGGQPDHYRVLI